MIIRKNSLKEAIRAGKSFDIVQKIVTILNRNISMSFTLGELPIEYSNSYGSFQGYLISIDDGSKLLRINFLLGSSSEWISSVDFFNSISVKPDVTLEYEKNTNIKEVVDIIIDYYKGNLE